MANRNLTPVNIQNNAPSPRPQDPKHNSESPAAEHGTDMEGPTPVSDPLPEPGADEPLKMILDLKRFRRPAEKTFTQRCRLFVGNLPTDLTEEDFRKLFAKYGEANEVFINRDRGFGFIRLETRTLAEIAKAELDGTVMRNRPIRVRFATHGSALTVRNLSPVVSNELLEQAFSQFGPVERAIVVVDDRGRPTGKGFVEFANKPAARKALDRCTDGAFLLTTSPRPVVVEPTDQEREQPPRFAEPGTFEFEYSSRWKGLDEMEKQQREQVERNIREAKEKLEAEMEAARHEHQLMMMRQDAFSSAPAGVTQGPPQMMGMNMPGREGGASMGTHMRPPDTGAMRGDRFGPSAPPAPPLGGPMGGRPGMEPQQQAPLVGPGMGAGTGPLGGTGGPAGFGGASPGGSNYDGPNSKRRRY
ncbi:hypothetical protein JZ751_025525 [Albula glossodonta]|uniref:Paraspeckle component 1 n=1 Tax=Albula glossodonta TaxID=121402 RepID=A0A8T2MQL0_9TELE|nr:hypothetical protein JZ751_025525 [Albula glossodonta]